MNERVTLFAAVLAGDIGASFALFSVRPNGALCGRYPNALTYAGDHLLISAVMWVLVLVLAWFAASSDLFRRRHRESAKVKILMRCMVVGVGVDAVASLYQLWAESDIGSQTPPVVGLAARAICWLALYVVVFGLILMYSRRRGRGQTAYVLKSDEDDLDVDSRY